MANNENIDEKLMKAFMLCTRMMMRGMAPGRPHTHHGQGAGHMHAGPPHRGQGRLLAILLENDGLPQKDIVEIMDIRPSSVGELVAKLEQAGLAERKENENDKRVVNVFLTEKGREAARQATDQRGKVSQSLFASFSDEEKQQLCALLEKLSASLREQRSQGQPDTEGFPPEHGFCRPPFGWPQDEPGEDTPFHGRPPRHHQMGFYCRRRGMGGGHFAE